MSEKKSISISMYLSLGALFYAISACDRNIREEEKATLRKALKKIWLPGDKKAMTIAHEFKRLLEEASDAWECYRNFERYMQENKKEFSSKIKSNIRHTVNAISDAVGGKNKSELVMLTQLDALLKAG